MEWCPKYRYNIFRKPNIKADYEQALKEAANAKEWQILELAVMPEHVHTAIRTTKPENPSYILFYLKGRSSYIMFRKHPNLRLRYPKGHLWSRGNYCRTVGQDIERARDYIRNQADIHQRKLLEFNEGSPHL